MVSTYDQKVPSTEVNKFLNLHGWIMKAMKQDIRAITTRISKKVFLGILDYEIVIDFEDLHRLYCHQDLDVNLITVWCLSLHINYLFCKMQWNEEELTNGRFKVTLTQHELASQSTSSN
ncbi:hypothetical protein SETIT_6G180100v2 [Setaria italica]|uniref:Uncharacterized protein n=1 Tax=Setaria italica TaxID=4555 RepID=A0A368RPE8_SETIT|nr:hypothetical protein SETIT_6G180100v2 [Setaria italica]